MAEVECRYCPATVRWARTTKGEAIPLEAYKVREGLRYALFDQQGSGDPVALVERSQPGYPPHWPRCDLDMSRAAKRARAAAEKKRQQDLFE